MTRLLLGLLRAYKIALSPFVGAQCRFLPTCSDYAREAVQQHGPARGSYLAARRLCRCHPLAQGGHDPVPPAARAAVSSDSASAHAAMADTPATPPPTHLPRP